MLRTDFISAFADMDAGDLASAAAGLLNTAACILLAAAFALWVIRCIGQTYILRAYGRSHPAAVWVPVIGPMLFVRGLRNDRDRITVFGKNIPAWIPSLFVIWALILAFVPYIGPLLSLLCTMVFYGSACIKVYTDFYCGRRRSTGIAVIGYVSGLIRLIATVHFFALMCRGWKPEEIPHGIPARKADRRAS